MTAKPLLTSEDSDMYGIKRSNWWWTGESKYGVTIFDRDIENAYGMEIDDAELTLAGIGFPFYTFPDDAEVVPLL